MLEEVRYNRAVQINLYIYIMATINYNFDINDFESKSHFNKILKGILTLVKNNPDGLVESNKKNKPNSIGKRI